MKEYTQVVTDIGIIAAKFGSCRNRQLNIITISDDLEYIHFSFNFGQHSFSSWDVRVLSDCITGFGYELTGFIIIDGFLIVHMTW